MTKYSKTASSCHGTKTAAKKAAEGIRGRGTNAKVEKNKATGKWCVYKGGKKKKTGGKKRRRRSR